jgi:hypothetical protein
MSTSPPSRVSSKQSNFFFGSNRNKPKLNLFWLFFGLFRETKKHFFRFVSVFQTGIETTETNSTLSKQTEKNLLLGGPQNNFFFLGLNRNKPKLNLFGFFCFFFVAKPKNLFSVCFGVSDQY